MSINLYEEALKVIPGGVNSPVRSFGSVGISPVFIEKAKGKYIYSAEGERYLDFCLSWGAIILGHSNPAINRAVRRALARGSSFGLCHSNEAELAKRIIRCMPSIEKIRFVNSGTEAVMSAVRLARGFTERNMIIKFDGCYHGHSDYLLTRAGSGLAEVSSPSSPGVPTDTVKNTLSVPFNNPEGLETVIKAHPGEIACVLMEPVPGNMGIVPPREGFLRHVRELTAKHGILLIFDEVITGFRVGISGVQGIEGIAPDLTTLGKIIGGGLPCGAFGGRTEIMDMLAPVGPVYQAGTLSGNPLAMTAGIAVLDELTAHPEIYSRMSELVRDFASEFRKKSSLTINTYKTLFSIFHTEKPVENFENACSQDMDGFRRVYRKLYERGILFPPSPYEACFLSALHNETDMRRILRFALE
jgi:glutamate-1-semialdehyde 2,1-aminomutase